MVEHLPRDHRALGFFHFHHCRGEGRKVKPVSGFNECAHKKMITLGTHIRRNQLSDSFAKAQIWKPHSQQDLEKSKSRMW